MSLTFRYILFFVPALLGLLRSGAQNLLANPSFEDVNICTEYKAPCAPSAWESVSPKVNKLDYMFHHYTEGAGNNLVRLIHSGPDELRNYAQTRLLCPLEKGRRYRLTVIGWQDGKLPPELDMRFDTDWLFLQDGGILPEEHEATLHIGARDLAAKKSGGSVFTLQKEFTASGAFNYVAIGTMRKTTRSSGRRYNYIDSVAIEPANGNGEPCEAARRVKDSLYARHDRHRIYLPGHLYKEDGHVSAVPLKCITIRVKDHTIFSAAGRTMQPDAATRLDSVVRVYDPAVGMKVRITGYAFVEGSASYNKVVADNNARKIMETLIYMKGFAFDDFTTGSVGNTRPQYDTATAEGREMNNFVEMEFCMPAPAEATGLSTAAAPQPDTLVVPDVLFRFNRSELNPGLYARLDSLLGKIPAEGNVQLQLVGHTDNRGDEEYNVELSRRRALSVAEYLRVKGLGNNIRHVSGEGEHRPVATNDTGEGRQRNRRVEIIVYRGRD